MVTPSVQPRRPFSGGRDVNATSGVTLVLGSAPDVLQCRDWPRTGFDMVVAINNAWRVRDDWDYLVAPDDFPEEKHPKETSPIQRVIGSDIYVPANNQFGGILYAGGTMAFTAGYWALWALRPRVLAFLGCDMIYPSQTASHFYGQGHADPLRDDISLRSLEAKSSRLMLHAARMGCACVRLSDGPSRLVFPSVARSKLANIAQPSAKPGGRSFDAATALEATLGYFVPTGRYWQETARFDVAKIDAVDAAWLNALSEWEGYRSGKAKTAGPITG